MAVNERLVCLWVSCLLITQWSPRSAQWLWVTPPLAAPMETRASEQRGRE